MAIKQYAKGSEKFFEVYLNTLDRTGQRVQIRRRGFTSIKEARAQEFELKRGLADKRDGAFPWTWEEWYQACVEKMRVELRPSTLMSYEGQLKKWVHPTWTGRELSTLTPTDVHELIYNGITGVSMNTRKTILKMLKRVLQMAVEDGVIDRNPALKVKVKVPERKQAILNATEVTRFINEAKATGHRFYEVWAVALLTGMRSGELYALKWSDIDFENRRITVSRSWCSKSGFGPTKTAKTRVVPVSVS